MRRWWILVVVGGCVSVERTQVVDVPSAGVRRVVGRVDSGSFSYRADSAARDFVVRGTSVGRGANRDRAEERADGNVLDARSSEGDLMVRGTSTEAGRAAWHLDVRGPEQVDLNVSVDDGDVYLYDAMGSHAVQADRIETQRLIGDADLVAQTNGVDAEIWPYEDGVILVDATGPVTLRLPAFVPYDLRVVGDPGQEMFVSDLGFDSLIVDDGYVEAIRQPGAVVVRVEVSGGSFALMESI